MHQHEHTHEHSEEEQKPKTPHHEKSCESHKSPSCHASGGAMYGFGLIGAAVYFLSNATGFWIGVWGILKAIAWPAVLIYELLKFFGI